MYVSSGQVHALISTAVHVDRSTSTSELVSDRDAYLLTTYLLTYLLTYFLLTYVLTYLLTVLTYLLTYLLTYFT